MDNRHTLPLPFLTKNMFAFEFGAALTLRMTVYSRIATALRLRGMTREGLFSYRAVVPATARGTDFDFRIPDFPIVLTVDATEESVNQGEIYIRVLVLANTDPLVELCSGFVYAGKSPTWPATTGLDRIPGHGNIQNILGSNPAAGAEISETVPSGRLWVLKSMSFELVTDANVGTRRVHVVLNDAVGQKIECFGTIDQAASLTRQYSCALYGSVPDETDGTTNIILLPHEAYITGLGSITTETKNIQTGDNFTAPKYTIEEWQQN